jgi:leader peptidase (prepilin peptidase)/N-methyltransferase
MLSTDAIHHWVGIGAVLMLGLGLGSFLTMLTHRISLRLLPLWQTDPTAPRVTPVRAWRSCCPRCGEVIPWYRNLPLVGWAVGMGRCSVCRQRVSLRYPVIELITALAVMVVWSTQADGWRIAALTIASIWLLGLSVIDAETRLLPDNLTLSGLWIGLLLSVMPVASTPPPGDAIIGAAAGYGLLAGLNAAYRLVRGHDGMGGGDCKLLAMLGAWTGPAALPVMLLISAGGGCIWLMLRRWVGTAGDNRLAFGPWLALSGWITLIWGHERFYL